ncbi:MAG: glycosyltransferase family 4 protein [Nitrospinaceae bacterium]|jgi:glycosyltransferase involved in cell wall biosynthesis|nr:glycosyltransferase family 4 protein [Nitrospinaceae bacterium]MBT3435146.1 glycosyltransferase family 4 protein [Nitrospinaceae bacterium]MBT3820427.1 glycosyltransferase family 4 protein [Nitrospinaceae bacterium]MBT4094706.1 glycosyltransferase family 4 protein [Nitrospinaceae bacterium]MBT4431039.1 glycosyltransferase family 4 protein [Nitrospinaceae bacterium]
MRQLKIIQIISSPWWTGAAEPALFLTKGLGDRGHELHFICEAGDNLEKQAKGAGYPRVEDVVPTRSLNPSRVWAAINSLATLIDKVDADIIHTHLSSDNWLSFFAIRRARKKPKLVRTIHHIRAAKASYFNKYLLARSMDAVIGVNNHIAGLLKTQIEVPPSQLHMVRGGIDIVRFHPPSIVSKVNGRDILALPDKALLIGIVSRLAPDRGFMNLLDAFKIVSTGSPQAHLVIVGKGEYLPSIKERVGALGLKDRVHFPGFIEDDLPEVLSAIDIFTLMAPGSEGTSRALLEAMAMGLPTVVTSHNGLDEVVRDTVTSYVVPPNNPGALAAGIQGLVADKGKRIQFGRAGRQRVERLFHNGYRAEMVENIYAQILEISPSPKDLRE